MGGESRLETFSSDYGALGRATQNRPVAVRDSVDDRARVAPAPVEAEPALMLVVRARPDGPGNLEAGFGSPDPAPGAAMREGGRRALLAAALGAPTDAARAMPAVALTPARGRGRPALTARGAARSLAARFGLWIPANLEAGAAPSAGFVVFVPVLVPELDVEPVDNADEAPWEGRPMTTLPSMPTGGRCTPRIGGRTGWGAMTGAGARTGAGASDARFLVAGSFLPAVLSWEAEVVLGFRTIFHVFFTMRSAGTGATTGGGSGSDSRRREGSSSTTGDVGGDGGSATASCGARSGVTRASCQHRKP